MSTDGTKKVNASSLLRENIRLVVGSAFIVVVGMALFSLPPPCDLTRRGWGLLLVVLATLILGGVLGRRAQKSDRGLSFKMLIGVAGRIGAIWLVLIECAEYGVTYLGPSLAGSFPTTSTSVEHYPIILVCTMVIVIVGFLCSYYAADVARRVWVKMSDRHHVAVVTLAAALTLVGANYSSYLTLKAAEYLYAHPGYGSIDNIWLRLILSKADDGNVQATLKTAKGLKFKGDKYKFAWYVQKDPKMLLDAWPYHQTVDQTVDCEVTAMLAVNAEATAVNAKATDEGKKRWLNGARITSHVTVCRNGNGNDKCKDPNFKEVATISSDYYRFCEVKNSWWNVVYDAPR